MVKEWQKLLGRLQESGNVTRVKHYLGLFEGAFPVKTLSTDTGSEVRKRWSSPKIVLLHSALGHAFRSPASLEADPDWYGRVFDERSAAGRLN
jgi:hypothetical protein